MSAPAEKAIREPSVGSPRSYARRVYLLAGAFSTLFVASLAGIWLVVWQAQLYVTLSQRSNVETLTLAFLVIFFAYLAVLSARGALGALQIAYYALRARLGGSGEAGERRKMRALGPATGQSPSVGTNMVLERESRPGESFTLRIADRAGSMGELVVDGVEITQHPTTKNGSTSLLAYFVEQVNHVLREREARAGLTIIHWKSIDDEETAQYVSIGRFARNLEHQLGASELWPKRVLSDQDCAELEHRLAAVCPALRNEAFLPHWEYQGQHQLPLIPQPLGLVSLSRTERRVDPVSSMGCAVLIVIGLLFVLTLIFLFPPWVPGA